MKRFLLILAACVLLPTAACSLRQKPTGEDYYAQGQLDFAQKEYKPAIENYQHLIDQFPFSPYAEDAEMKIGLAYYQQQDYAEAIAALDDFQRMHPTSKNLELVTYYIAMSYYVQMGREDQDQTKTEQALKRFQELEQRFPEGDFASLAHEHIVVCREMLSRHAMIVGNYYFKRANFRAAESRFAELMQRYPDSPVAPDALYELGISLEKEGKKYSAAQAFAALQKHFPNTTYAKKAQAELKKLHQPIDTEEDPLPLVLAETGYGGEANDAADKVLVRQRSEFGGAGSAGATDPSAGGAYGSDGLPVLTQTAKAATPSAPDAKLPPDFASAAKAQSGAISGLSAAGIGSPRNANPAAAAASAAAPGGGDNTQAPPAAVHLLDSAAIASRGAAVPTAPPPAMHQMASATGDASTADNPPLSAALPPPTGPATLKTIRLSANDPPLSLIIDLSGPVQFDKHLESTANGSTATVLLKDVTPDSGLQTHLVFDKSIFKDCNISSGSSGTTVTLNMQPIDHFAVVPLDQPPRLLVTFTPQREGPKTSSAR